MRKFKTVLCAIAITGICSSAFCAHKIGGMKESQFPNDGLYEKAKAAKNADAPEWNAEDGQKDPEKDILNKKFDGSEGELKKEDKK